MTTQLNARNLAAIKNAWLAACEEQKAHTTASTSYRNSIEVVGAMVNALAVKMDVDGPAATDLFLANVKVSLRNVKEMTDGAFRKMWSRLTKWCYAAIGSPLVISAAVKADSAKKRAGILKAFAASYTFDKAAAQALIKKHMEDEAFLVNAGKLIAQLSEGKEVFRLAKIVKGKALVVVNGETKAAPVVAKAKAAKVVGKIAPVVAKAKAKRA